jgi:competence protein ComEC
MAARRLGVDESKSRAIGPGAGHLNMPVRWLWVLPGWVLGVWWHLQQARLGHWSESVALCALGLGVGLVAVRWRTVAWPVLLLALASGAMGGAGVAGLWASRHAARALSPALEGVDLVVVGRVASLPQRGADSVRFELEVDSAARAGQAVALPLRLQLSWYTRGAGSAGPVWRAGDRWQLTVRLRRPHGLANPHGFDRERWLWENGIGATGYIRNGPRDAVPRYLGRSAAHPVEAARQMVSERIGQRISDARSAGVLAALVVGDQSAIDRSDWALFRGSGVAHLMSISGLHVTLFAWLATGLLGRAWRRLGRAWPRAMLALPAQTAAAWGGVGLAGAYAVFSGWGVPAQRTVLMLAVVVALRQSARRWPLVSVWLLVMVAVLLFDPWALLQPGFWLSFVAVGILFASGKRQTAGPSHPHRVRRWAASAWALFREQATVTVALTPLSLLLFGQVSVVGLVANLFAIPWVTLLVTPLALAGVLWPPLWDAAALAVQGLVVLLKVLAEVPGAAVFRPIPPLPLALVGILGGVCLVLRLPWVLRAVGLVCLWPLWAWSPQRPLSGEFEVMAIDVGQGSAVLLRTAHHSLLYDTGPRYGTESDAGERVVVPLLRALGESPDTVVVSHRDSDHSGGSQAVRDAWPKARWLSSFDAGERCVSGQRWTWDGVTFDMLHPSPALYGPDGQGLRPTNAMSCVLRVTGVRDSAWLSGDLDAEGETRLALTQPTLRATLMLAPHHGSASSSSPVLLNTLRPSHVIVQSGYRNRFGHPAAVVQERYRSRGIKWVESPHCGAALWRSTEPNAVHCLRTESPRYWQHRAVDEGAAADHLLQDGETPSHAPPLD